MEKNQDVYEVGQIISPKNRRVSNNLQYAKDKKFYNESKKNSLIYSLGGAAIGAINGASLSIINSYITSHFSKKGIQISPELVSYGTILGAVAGASIYAGKILSIFGRTNDKSNKLEQGVRQ